MDVNPTDKRHFYTAESIVQDERENLGKRYKRVENTDKGIDSFRLFYLISHYFHRNANFLYFAEYATRRKNDGFAKMKVKEESPLTRTKRSRNQSKLKKLTDTSSTVKPKKRKKKKCVRNDRDNDEPTDLPGIY